MKSPFFYLSILGRGVKDLFSFPSWRDGDLQVWFFRGGRLVRLLFPVKPPPPPPLSLPSAMPLSPLIFFFFPDKLVTTVGSPWFCGIQGRAGLTAPSVQTVEFGPSAGFGVPRGGKVVFF